MRGGRGGSPHGLRGEFQSWIQSTVMFQEEEAPFSVFLLLSWNEIAIAQLCHCVALYMFHCLEFRDCENAF